MPYITDCARHKLLFVSNEIEDITFVDIGAKLSAAIEHSLQNKRISMIAEDALEKIINQNTICNPDIGDLVAIKNYGILFEPALHINIHAKFDSWAKSKVLLVLLEGTIMNKIFYLSHCTDSKYSINLRDITYNTLYNEI